jgi:hypothetical protein
MSEPKIRSDLKTSNWADLGQWLKALTRHWIARIGGPLIAAFQILYGIWRRDWPPALGWAILAGCFVWATFLAWRDEHRKTIGKNRRSILQKAVEIVNSSHRNVDHIVAVIELSDEFGSEEDVEWVCQQLDEHGHGDPFGILHEMFEPGFDGKRLKFLQDARVAQYPIGSLSDAVNYVMYEWASKNGLTETRTRAQ